MSLMRSNTINKMNDLIPQISVETYTYLLKLYKDLLFNLNRFPVIRKPNRFYDYLEQEVFSRFPDDKIHHYVVRDVLPNLEFLKSVFDDKYFYRVSITIDESGDNILSNVDRLNPVGPKLQDGITFVIMLVDISSTQCLQLCNHSSFELFVPISTFACVSNNYFNMIIKQHPDILTTRSEIPSDISLTDFHKTFTYLITDVNYLRHNVKNVTNEIYTLLEYFCYNEYIEVVDEYYETNGDNPKAVTLFERLYNIDFVSSKTDRNTRFVYKYKRRVTLEPNDFRSKQQRNMAMISNIIRDPNFRNVEFSRTRVEYSIASLKKDVILFKRLLLYCRAIPIYNNLLNNVIHFDPTLFFERDVKSDSIESPASNRFLFEENVRGNMFVNRIVNINEIFVRGFVRSLEYCLAKFSLDSELSRIVKIIKKHERIKNNNPIEPSDKNKKIKIFCHDPPIHTDELNNKLIEWIVNHIVMCERSILKQGSLLMLVNNKFSMKDICSFSASKLDKLRDLCPGMSIETYNETEDKFSHPDDGWYTSRDEPGDW